MPAFLWIFFGLVILTVGADAMVRGSVAVARRAGISPLVIGLTVVAFGTSAPELAVSVQAALGGQGNISIGNIVGSNIFNVAGILGIAALIRPLEVHLQVIRREMVVMIGVSILGAFFFLSGGMLSRWEGGVLFAGIVAYTWLSVRAERQEEKVMDPGIAPEPTGPQSPLWLDLTLLVGGLALLVLGASWLVAGAVEVARTFGVSEAVIGLTIVAAGTSLPELATTVTAALRRQTDLAVGNVIGSNVFNILSIGGITGLIAPVRDISVGVTDYAFMIGISLLLLPLLWTGLRLVRWEGGVLLACQVIYLGLLWPK